jgi:hypothetical protein
VATVDVGMATWKAIRSHRRTKDPEIQSSIELAFINEWLHLNILGMDNATIRWHFLPPLYYLHFVNDLMGLLPPSPQGVHPAPLHKGYIKMTCCPRTPERESRNCEGWNSRNFAGP